MSRSGAGGLAATWGNPTVRDPRNHKFPFDRYAAGVLSAAAQRGLVTDPAVHAEFLNPPASSFDWFSRKAWDALAPVLEHDQTITFDQYESLKNTYQSIENGLVKWTQLRDPGTATDGYGQLSADMRKAGSDAYTGIRSITNSITALRQQPNLAAGTGQALGNFNGVLWEYAQCMAYELEASADETDVTAIRERVAREVTHGWEPAVDPDNVDDPNVIGGAHRLPKLPDDPGGKGKGKGKEKDPDKGKDPDRGKGGEHGDGPGR